MSTQPRWKSYGIAGIAKWADDQWESLTPDKANALEARIAEAERLLRYLGQTNALGFARLTLLIVWMNEIDRDLGTTTEADRQICKDLQGWLDESTAFLEAQP